ncbi:hypothetical protein L1987_80674 [Smallanthus sonchifolius]|uniref:Uncharacterized protein n=1 Tax=Smallanthus sonchifolius TaxID=185202 RepID=A0ACB8YML2_9ASTR|nr:hypothetical protein L1987_80674 [Smallanthus sonchifolius]
MLEVLNLDKKETVSIDTISNLKLFENQRDLEITGTAKRRGLQNLHQIMRMMSAFMDQFQWLWISSDNLTLWISDFLRIEVAYGFLLSKTYIGCCSMLVVIEIFTKWTSLYHAF